MILYTKKDCRNCENVKKYIVSAKLDNIEIMELNPEARKEMIRQGAKEMPLLVDRNNFLLSQGSKVIEFLIKSRK